MKATEQSPASETHWTFVVVSLAFLGASVYLIQAGIAWYWALIPFIPAVLAGTLSFIALLAFAGALVYVVLLPDELVWALAFLLACGFLWNAWWDSLSTPSPEESAAAERRLERREGNPVPENREASALTRRKYDGVEHLGQRGHLTFTQRQLQFSQHRQESRTYHWDGGDYHRPVTVTGDVFTYKFADIEAADSAGWDLLLLTKDHETVRFRCRNRAQAQEVAGLVNARI